MARLLDKGRVWLRWLLRNLRERRESRAFYRAHGPVVKVEELVKDREPTTRRARRATAELFSTPF